MIFIFIVSFWWFGQLLVQNNPVIIIIIILIIIVMIWTFTCPRWSHSHWRRTEFLETDFWPVWTFYSCNYDYDGFEDNVMMVRKGKQSWPLIMIACLYFPIYCLMAIHGQFGYIWPFMALLGIHLKYNSVLFESLLYISPNKMNKKTPSRSNFVCDKTF